MTSITLDDDSLVDIILAKPSIINKVNPALEVYDKLFEKEFNWYQIPDSKLTDEICFLAIKHCQRSAMKKVKNITPSVIEACILMDADVIHYFPMKAWTYDLAKKIAKTNVYCIPAVFQTEEVYAIFLKEGGSLCEIPKKSKSAYLYYMALNNKKNIAHFPDDMYRNLVLYMNRPLHGISMFYSYGFTYDKNIILNNTDNQEHATILSLTPTDNSEHEITTPIHAFNTNEITLSIPNADCHITYAVSGFKYDFEDSLYHVGIKFRCGYIGSIFSHGDTIRLRFR